MQPRHPAPRGIRLTLWERSYAARMASLERGSPSKPGSYRNAAADEALAPLTAKPNVSANSKRMACR